MIGASSGDMTRGFRVGPPSWRRGRGVEPGSELLKLRCMCGNREVAMSLHDERLTSGSSDDNSKKASGIGLGLTFRLTCAARSAKRIGGKFA